MNIFFATKNESIIFLLSQVKTVYSWLDIYYTEKSECQYVILRGSKI